MPLVSIVISNYNYARYLPDAVESALNQTYPRVEVVVVDDGSTDDSLSVLSRYPSVTVVKKVNGGHASALNAGFRASHGEIVFFLDADDVLYVDAVQVVVEGHEHHIASHQFRLDVVDEHLKKSNEVIPARAPDSGDLRLRTLRRGPGSRVCPPCSGLAWSRAFLARAMPLPEVSPTTGAEPFLTDVAPLYGSVHTHDRVLGAYRRHESSMQMATHQLDQRLLERIRRSHEARREFLARHAGVEPLVWRDANWRISVVETLSERGAHGRRPPVRPLIDASMSCERPLPLRVMLAVVLMVIWAVPLSVAWWAARRILEMKYL